MDGKRFDGLVQRLLGRPMSRRKAIATVAAGCTVASASWYEEANAKKKKNRQRVVIGEAEYEYVCVTFSKCRFDNRGKCQSCGGYCQSISTKGLCTRCKEYRCEWRKVSSASVTRICDTSSEVCRNRCFRC